MAMRETRDVNDRLRAGDLPADPLDGTEPVNVERVPRLLHAIQAGIVAATKPRAPNPLATGFSELDSGLRMYGPKEVTMLAADSGVGKSTIATQAVLHAGAAGHGVVYLNLEMSLEMYGLRTLANYIKLPMGRARAGELLADDHRHLYEGMAALRVASARVALGNAREHRTMPAIRQLVEQAAAELAAEGTPLTLIVVDHVLQIQTTVRGGDKDGEGKARADFLKDLAETFKVHVLALVHITREGSKAGTMPTKNQLASSAWFDRHADNILVFHQKRAPNGTFAGTGATLSCQKSRWGSPFAVELEYQLGFFFPWELVRGTQQATPVERPRAGDDS